MAKYWEINGGKFRVEYDPATGRYVEKPAPDAKARASLRRKHKKAQAASAAAAALAEETKEKQQGSD